MSALSDLAHGLPVEGLVPGDADGVAALGDALAGYADLLADAAHALGRVEVSWDGSAAARFRDEFGLQPGRFSAAAGCFDAASTSLGRYAATLASAQLAAARARDMYAEGVRAAIAAGGGPLGVDAGPLDALLSPAGREQRLAAVELLERVRADVDRAGNETAECLRTAVASTPEPVSAWQHAWNFLLAPPWDLNQERRDWGAGAAVGILDTLVLASNPLPIALWVGASTKPQVNAFEWRLGADPRSGFHTAGAVVVPAVLTGTGALGGVSGRLSTRLGAVVSEAAPEKGLNVVPRDLSAFGNATRPRPPRPQDMLLDEDGMTIPQSGIEVRGASTTYEPLSSSLNGHFHTVPAGTELPDGIAVVLDGREMRGPRTPFHATIYAEGSMPQDEFVQKFLDLPWQYGGRKK